ncbi:MAG: signal peptidase II [SAR324 cluster bacterium]|nr:signal peptidase II [SAR324 cluster bacterium]
MHIKLTCFIIGTLLVGFIDQASKKIAISYLLLGAPPIEMIPGFIDFKLVYNSGVSFGFLSHNGSTIGWILLSSVTIFIIAYLIQLVIRRISKISKLGLTSFCFIIGGALGNGVDRIFYQQVTDFMIFRIGDITLFVNNLADDAISIGLILLIFEALILRRSKNSIKAILK